jgi:hypothetical protein
MTNEEILENLLFYEKSLLKRKRYSRLLTSENLPEGKRLDLDSRKPDKNKLVLHSMYMIVEIRKMIDRNEKSERVHRHYASLQTILWLHLFNWSLNHIMRDNKYGCETWRNFPLEE